MATCSSSRPIGNVATLQHQPTPPRHLQEALDGDLLVFSPYPSLSKFLRDSGLVAHTKACEVAW